MASSPIPSPSTHSSPDEFRHVATTCRSIAVALIDSRAQLDAHVTTARWQGPGADRLRAATTGDRPAVDALAYQLASVDHDLTLHAAWVEHRSAQLLAIERRVCAWITAHPPIPGSPGPDASMIGIIPPSGSAEWERIEAQLRQLGQVL